MSDAPLFDPHDPEPVPEGRPVLLPIQQDLLDRGARAYRGDVRRVIWQAHCGAGKTVVGGEQVRRAREKNKTAIWIVHRRRLVDQAVGTLRRFGVQAAPLMEGRQTWPSAVYCASRDTLLAMLKAGRALPVQDLVIFDEAHVAAGEVQQWYLDHAPGAYWTGYTATPVRPDGGSLNPPYQALVCMGPVSELVRVGRLCPAKVFNPDAVGRRRRAGDRVKPVGDPVAHWLKYAPGLPTIAFAGTVAESKDLARRYLEAGVSAEHLDASTPDEEREAIYERSRTGATKVICNCGVVIEGVDLPWLVCCQILRGCNSLVLWIQATGRVLRFFPGKPCGIVLDHAGAAHEYGLPDSDFVWTLEDGRANERQNRPPKDAKPVVCQACGFVFARKPACPECGRVLPVKRRRSLLAQVQPGDGVLTEFTERQNVQTQQDVLVRLFRRCYHIARAKGGTMAQANAIFTQNARLPAWEAGLPLNIPVGPEWRTPAKEWKL